MFVFGQEWSLSNELYLIRCFYWIFLFGFRCSLGLVVTCRIYLLWKRINKVDLCQTEMGYVDDYVDHAQLPTTTFWS